MSEADIVFGQFVRTVQAWQPIEAAPERQTILVYVPDARREQDAIQTGRYGMTANNMRLWVIGGLMGFDVGKPTHWQPLPEPPK